MVFRGHCNACIVVVVVVVVMWPLSVACCGQVPTPVPMKDILAIKFDVNMVKTRNKYFKLNTTCASCNWKLNKNCVTMMIFRQFDLQLATESLRPSRFRQFLSSGCINFKNLSAHQQEEVLRIPKHPSYGKIFKENKSFPK